MLDWFQKAENIISSLGKNEIFDYLKYIVYNTDDKKMIEQKDKALNSLFAGMEALNKKNFESAMGFIEQSIGIFTKTNDELRKAISEFFMGEAYKLKENTEKAKEYYEKAFEVLKKNGNMMAHTIEQKLKELNG